MLSMILEPYSSYCCLVTQASSIPLVEVPIQLAPMNTLNFLVGGSATVTWKSLLRLPFNAYLWSLSTSFLSLVGNPANMVVPPEIKIFLKKKPRRLMSVLEMEL